MSSPPGTRGLLVVVGVGIEWAGQTTLAAQTAIQGADVVLYAVASPWAASWIHTLNPRAQPFAYPRGGTPRADIYQAMVERILEQLRAGQRVCAVFYGHPGLLVKAGHEAIRQARREEHSARMLPGVSSLDCLFADLGFEPGAEGCQMFEATSFVRRPSAVDPTIPLALFQIALIEHRLTYDGQPGTSAAGLRRLRDKLLTSFPPDHAVTIYEAPTHPLQSPRIEIVPVSALAEASVSEVSTLFVPARAADAREQMFTVCAPD